MIFIDYFKLFAFCCLSLVVSTQARSVSYSQIGDIRIVHEDDKWICDKIECPKDTYRCFVSKSNEKDPAVLVRTNICYSQDNTSLAESVTTTSVDAKNKIRVQINSYRNGMTTSSNYYVDKDFNEEEFQKNMQKEMQHLGNEMKNLHSNIEEMNENIQKNLQHQMSDLQENLKNMQHNLAHMFD